MKAFPNGLVYGREQDGGMELRDYFAAKAMPVVFEMMKHNYGHDLGNDFEYTYDNEEFECLTSFSYQIADAMMKARENKDAN